MMKGLTEVEKRFIVAMEADPEAPSALDLNNPKHWSDLRNTIKKTAYHEAGHYAASWFMGSTSTSPVHHISIIPENGSIGRICYDSFLPEWWIESVPPPLRRTYRLMYLLEIMAGSGASIIAGSIKNESILTCLYLDVLSLNGEKTKASKTEPDGLKAYRIVRQLEKSYMPMGRIISLAEKWTMEMLHISAVWNVVETVARKLIKHGIVMDRELRVIEDDSLSSGIYNYVKWKRRIFPKPGELEKDFMVE